MFVERKVLEAKEVQLWKNAVNSGLHEGSLDWGSLFKRLKGCVSLGLGG